MTVLPSLSLCATFTAEPLRDTLDFWLQYLGWPMTVQFAPYNQVFQTLLAPDGVFTDASAANMLLVRLADWEELGALMESAERLPAAVDSYRARTTAPLMICFCPSPDESVAVRSAEQELTQRLSAVSGVTMLSAERVLKLYPAADVHLPNADERGHVPYTSAFFVALGSVLIRTVHALRQPPAKVLVLDCDNTLWLGTCGEDGPEHVRVDAPRRALQEFALAQRAQGMLLCLASKNNEEDVWDTFRAHPEMPLQPEHITAWRINWEPKGENLRALAAELSLGLDSFVFLDDDHKECGEVQARCPEVVALALPHESAELPHFLQHLWVFDRAQTTAEDAARADEYSRMRERQQLQARTVSLADFVRELQLAVNIQPPTAAQWPRVAQLTQRTNQMNLTTVRRTEAELQALVRGGEMECLAAEVHDRFGAYGLVGVMLFSVRDETLVIDTFLLSCRALGRGVEHRLLAHLGQLAEQRGLLIVEIPLVPTAKNRPAQDWLAQVSTQLGVPGPPYRFAAADIAALVYAPPEGTPVTAATTDPVTSTTPERRANYGAIARHLSRVADIQAAARTPGQKSRVLAPEEEPRTERERELAAIWAELLNVSNVGVHDDFFDLGGHSLLAVQLLAQVQQRLGVDLPMDVVYTGTLTVGGMAKAIEMQELGPIDPAEYDALLAEIETLSDDEVRQLLAEEETRS